MTIDKRQLPALPGQIPDFTPVPRGRQRHDGWTEERQRRFIEALSVTGSVKAAAHRVNMTPEGAYLLRRHPEAESFRKAWEAALSLGVQQLEDVAPIDLRSKSGISTGTGARSTAPRCRYTHTASWSAAGSSTMTGC